MGLRLDQIENSALSHFLSISFSLFYVLSDWILCLRFRMLGLLIALMIEAVRASETLTEF
jgi:hypothetical protein